MITVAVLVMLAGLLLFLLQVPREPKPWHGKMNTVGLVLFVVGAFYAIGKIAGERLL
jgi:hypothetical protein